MLNIDLTGKRIEFNDDSTQNGMEGWTQVIGHKLVIFVYATSNRFDWMVNFKCWPKKLEPENIWMHASYYPYAQYLYAEIMRVLTEYPQIKEIVLFGYSVGGGIAVCAGKLLDFCNMSELIKVVNIDGPPVIKGMYDKVVTYYKTGSIVYRCIPWFDKYENKVCLEKKWQPFWKAHAIYCENGEMEKIVQEVIAL